MAEVAVCTSTERGYIANQVHLDVTQIPDYKVDLLCEAVLGLVRKIRSDPELSRQLDERNAAQNAREAAAAASKAPGK